MAAKDSQTISLNPNDYPQLARSNTTTKAFRWPLRRRISLRRRKLPVIRLGGKSTKRTPRGRIFLARIMRRVRMRWLRLQCIRMVNKLRGHYKNFTKDLKEASAALEMFQQRALMETSFAVPLGVSFASFPSIAGSDRARNSFFM